MEKKKREIPERTKLQKTVGRFADKLSPGVRRLVGLRRGLRNPNLEKIIRATNRASGRFNHAPDSFDSASMLREDPGIYAKADKVKRLLTIERKKAKARLFKDSKGMPRNYKDR